MIFKYARKQLKLYKYQRQLVEKGELEGEPAFCDIYDALEDVMQYNTQELINSAKAPLINKLTQCNEDKKEMVTALEYCLFALEGWVALYPEDEDHNDSLAIDTAKILVKKHGG